MSVILIRNLYIALWWPVEPVAGQLMCGFSRAEFAFPFPFCFVFPAASAALSRSTPIIILFSFNKISSLTKIQIIIYGAL